MFKPKLTLSSHLVSLLVKIEKLKDEIDSLPITGTVLQSLRESSRANSSHYSTFIEGNKLTQKEVADLLQNGTRVPHKERDEKEVLGYYAALEVVKKLAITNAPISENAIQRIHATVMAGGKTATKTSPYRDGQNVIKDSVSGSIVYLPPEASDVPHLMKDLVEWLLKAETYDFPAPINAAIAHYQFATIHPYYDGNGRTARLLTNWLLHQRGYGLKGIYSLEEYYAQNLPAYYDAISIGPSHNYYFGREKADITPWIIYFCTGMLESFKQIKGHAEQALNKGIHGHSFVINFLNKPEQSLLAYFKHHDEVTTQDVAMRFKLSNRTARNWVKKWVDQGFLTIQNPSKIKRSYRLAQQFRHLTG